MNHVPDPPDSDGAATGEPSSLAVTDESPNGSVPRLGRPYSRDYGALLGRPYPPQGTSAASGGRPEHGRADGGTGLGQQCRRAGPIIRRAADPAVGDGSRCPRAVVRPGAVGLRVVMGPEVGRSASPVMESLRRGSRDRWRRNLRMAWAARRARGGGT